MTTKELNFDYSLIDNITFDGIDYADFPDFSDAYIQTADYKGVPMTDDEINLLNEDDDYVHEKLWDYLH